jgi:hypothetical protein
MLTWRVIENQGSHKFRLGKGFKEERTRGYEGNQAYTVISYTMGKIGKK